MNSGHKHESENIGAELREYLDAFRGDVHEQAEKPEWFWSAQRAKIRARLRERPAGSLRLVFASLAAVLAVALSMVLSGPKLSTHGPVPQTAQVHAHEAMSDDALMAEVVDETEYAVPDALAPANALAQELDQGLKSASAGKGETR